jgi:hypothetical protein
MSFCRNRHALCKSAVSGAQWGNLRQHVQSRHNHDRYMQIRQSGHEVSYHRVIRSIQQDSSNLLLLPCSAARFRRSGDRLIQGDLKTDSSTQLSVGESY